MSMQNLHKSWWRTLIKVLVALVMVVVIVQLFPRKDTLFVYKYEQDKPWQHGLLTAPFDFPVYGIVMDTTMVDDSTFVVQEKRAQIALVQEGEKIITRGEKVTQQAFSELEALKQEIEKNGVARQQVVWSRVGSIAFIIFFVGLMLAYMLVFRPHLFDDLRSWFFFSILMTGVILICCFVLRFSSFSVYVVPFAWVPIIAHVFYDSRTAFYLHTLTVLICAFIVPQPFEFLVLQMSVGMVVMSCLKEMQQRSQLAQTAIFVALTYALCYTAFMLFTTGDPTLLDWHMYVYFAVNALLVVFAYGLIYLFEKTFGLVSSITLVELTNINSDLMMEFSEKAPGTFQHSLQVSNLAMAAAKRVGANALLVRTGALYHDIGKMAHPENYTENQSAGNNPLLELSSIDASAAVISHVTDGVKMAKKENLPDVIISFIQSHHGTSTTRFFYNTYVNEHPGEEVDKTLFMYPGPRPATKEVAILMMADAVEARSRSLTDCTPESIRQMVDQMVGAQLADGQFENTPLTFKDMQDIKEEFVRKLVSMNHHRIAYPEIKK